MQRIRSLTARTRSSTSLVRLGKCTSSDNNSNATPKSSTVGGGGGETPVTAVSDILDDGKGEGSPPPEGEITQPPSGANGVVASNESLKLDTSSMSKSDKSGDKKKSIKLLRGLSFKRTNSRVVENKDEGKKEKLPSKSLGGLGKAPAVANSKNNTSESAASNTSNSATKPSNLTAPKTSTSTKPTPAKVAEAKKWKATLDKSTNKYYYYHRETKEVTWDKPLGFDEAHGIVVEKGVIAGEESAVGATAVAEKESDLKGKESMKEVADKMVEQSKEAIKELLTESKKSTETKKSGGMKKIGLVGLRKSKAKVTESIKPDAGNDSAVAVASGAENDTKEDAPVPHEKEEAKYWRATVDATTGKTYYYNKKTKQVTWSKPACMVEKKKLDEKKTCPSLVEQWCLCFCLTPQENLPFYSGTNVVEEDSSRNHTEVTQSSEQALNSEEATLGEDSPQVVVLVGDHHGGCATDDIDTIGLRGHDTPHPGGVADDSASVDMSALTWGPTTVRHTANNHHQVVSSWRRFKKRSQVKQHETEVQQLHPQIDSLQLDIEVQQLQQRIDALKRQITENNSNKEGDIRSSGG